MKNRLTYKEPSGEWGLLKEKVFPLSDAVYGAVRKLLNYEETGLSPDEVERMQAKMKKVHIGMKVEGYEVVGMFENTCIAHSKTAPDPWVVWTIDADQCGVHGGRYRSSKEEAVQEFLESAFGIEMTDYIPFF